MSWTLNHHLYTRPIFLFCQFQIINIINNLHNIVPNFVYTGISKQYNICNGLKCLQYVINPQVTAQFLEAMNSILRYIMTIYRMFKVCSGLYLEPYQQGNISNLLYIYNCIEFPPIQQLKRRNKDERQKVSIIYLHDNTASLLPS